MRKLDPHQKKLVESTKLDTYKKKSIIMGDIRQNVLEVHKSIKLDPRKKKIIMVRGINKNMYEVHESKKLDPHKKNSS